MKRVRDLYLMPILTRGKEKRAVRQNSKSSPKIVESRRRNSVCLKIDGEACLKMGKQRNRGSDQEKRLPIEGKNAFSCRRMGKKADRSLIGEDNRIPDQGGQGQKKLSLLETHINLAQWSWAGTRVQKTSPQSKILWGPVDRIWREDRPRRDNRKNGLAGEWEADDKGVYIRFE